MISRPQRIAPRFSALAPPVATEPQDVCGAATRGGNLTRAIQSEHATDCRRRQALESGKKLGRQNEREKIGLQGRERGSGSPAKAPPRRPLVAPSLQRVAELLPGTDRVRGARCARARAQAGGRLGAESAGAAQHHSGRSHFAPRGAPLMRAIGTNTLLELIMGTGQLGHAITLKQAWPRAPADLQTVP